MLVDSLKPLGFLFQVEYQKILYSNLYSGIQMGGEITFLELLSLRSGYYDLHVNDYGNPTQNQNRLSSFTYGFGLQVPFYKLTKLPLRLNLDYTSLPQPPYSRTKTDLANFNSINLRIIWMIKK